MAVAAGRSSFIRAARRTPGEGRGLGLGSELGSGSGWGWGQGYGQGQSQGATLTTLTTQHLLLNTYYAHYSTLTTLTTLADLGIVHRASEAVAARPIREERHVDRRVAEGRPAHLASRR